MEGTRLRVLWISQASIHDRPEATEHILEGELQFSDGTTVRTGELPNDGSGKEIWLDKPIDASSVKFVVINGKGVNIGLADIEILAE